MAGLNFDDGEKKPRDILDLSHVSIKSGIELKKWMEKVPDFKIRPEKVRWEEVRIDEDQMGQGSQGGSPVRHGPGPTGPYDPDTSPAGAGTSGGYQFCDPVPASMKDINLKELGRVNINWRMLTVARPKNKLEEDIFSRLIQLEKLQYKTIQWEIEQEAIRQRKGGPFTRGAPFIRGGRTRAGGCGASRAGAASTCRAAVTETRLQTCKECGEEFCTGQTCQKYLYDDHSRTLNPPNDDIFKIHPRGSKKNKKAAGGNGESKLDDGRPEVDEIDDVEAPAATHGTNGAHAGAHDADPSRTGSKSNTKKVPKKLSTSQVENGAKTKVHKATKKHSKKK